MLKTNAGKFKAWEDINKPDVSVAVSLGTVYKTLLRLDAKGLVAARIGERLARRCLDEPVPAQRRAGREELGREEPAGIGLLDETARA